MCFRFRRICFFCVWMMMMACTTPGQGQTPSATWLLPGAKWTTSEKLALQAQLGYNRYLRAGLFYPQAFITVHKNIVLNPAYIYLLQQTAGKRMLQEHYLMNAVILQATDKRLFVDDRNMLWNRFTEGMEARHYYRNRLRIMEIFNSGPGKIKPYGYDEIFYLFNNRELARNRAAIGVSVDIKKYANVDIAYIRQWDRYAGNLNLVFITALWQW